MHGGLKTGETPVHRPSRPADQPTARPGREPAVTVTSQERQAGTTVSASVTEMGPFERLLTGTSWDRDELRLALQLFTTILLLLWLIMEVR